MRRRDFFVGVASLVAAPAIVRMSSLMPVRDIEVFDPVATVRAYLRPVATSFGYLRHDGEEFITIGEPGWVRVFRNEGIGGWVECEAR